MTPAETAAILRQFNEWRRGGDIEQPGRLAVGEAIDAAVEMIDRLEAAEKSDAESIAMYRKARDERDALRAKIEAMEKQEPVATVRINAINGNPSVDFVPGHRYLHHNDKLFTLPGAQPAPSAPEVTDAMALAFHSALTAGSIGEHEMEEIKAGLRAALAAAPEAKP